MIVLLSQVVQASLWMSDMVGFKNINLESINASLTYGSVRRVLIVLVFWKN